MTIILYILVGLFGLKILWNLAIPYELALRKTNKGGRKISGISIVPLVEIGLLLLAAGAAALSAKQGWLQSPKNIVIWGLLAIGASYVHLVIAGMVMGWIVSHKRR